MEKIKYKIRKIRKIPPLKPPVIYCNLHDLYIGKAHHDHHIKCPCLKITKEQIKQLRADNGLK